MKESIIAIGMLYGPVDMYDMPAAPTNIVNKANSNKLFQLLHNKDINGLIALIRNIDRDRGDLEIPFISDTLDWQSRFFKPFITKDDSRLYWENNNGRHQLDERKSKLFSEPQYLCMVDSSKSDALDTIGRNHGLDIWYTKVKDNMQISPETECLMAYHVFIEKQQPIQLKAQAVPKHYGELIDQAIKEIYKERKEASDRACMNPTLWKADI